MIESKYGMKYPFPHTLIHIIDNSGFNGVVPVVTADDPSIFSTMVISGFPMGEDGKMLKVTRSDVVRVAFGVNNLTTNDRKKYGQAVDYPLSLITQGAPVQLMRVTPEGSQYGFVTIQIRYKWVDDGKDSRLHVKFLTNYDTPTGTILSNFKNPEKLAQAIIAQGNRIPDSDGWTTRVFAVIVAAGRGAVYNNMHFTVNTVNQAKRPANAIYTFGTVDSRTSSVIEEFTASLVNVDNVDRLDYTETVNNQIHQRDPGSSVLKPIINEKVIGEVFETYIKHYKDMLDTGEFIGDELVNQAIKTLNVNTFDIITGKYLYNGGLGTHLPFFQVDAIDKDLPQLPITNRMYNEYDEDHPGDYTILKDSMINNAYGVMRNGCSTYLGDVYLTTLGSKNLNPRLSIICGINQYSGAITSVQFDEIQLKSTLGGEAKYSKIVKVYESGTDLNSDRLIADGLKVGDVFARFVTDRTSGATISFELHEVKAGQTEGTLDRDMYDNAQIIKALPYTSRTGVENVISLYNGDVTDSKFTTRGYTPGFAIINLTTGSIYVNDYDITTSDGMTNLPGASDTHKYHRILVTNNALKVGTVPTVIDGTNTTAIVGSSYDVMSYPSENITSWRLAEINPADIKNGGSGYNVNDVVSASKRVEKTIDGETVVERYFIELIVSNVGMGAIMTLKLPTDSSKTSCGGKFGYDEDIDLYALLTTEPSDWGDPGASYYKYDETTKEYVAVTSDDTWEANKYYRKSGAIRIQDENQWVVGTSSDNKPAATGDPEEIKRYSIDGVIGSLFKINSVKVEIPKDYYSPEYGENLDSMFGGVKLENGDAGFFDDPTISDIEFKYRYAALLTEAFRGRIDPRVMSPIRTPAKFLFDAAYNTVVGSAFATLINHSVSEWINGSVIFTDDEKDEVLFDPSLIKNLAPADLDVKQAMYDLMIQRVYDLMPEDKRPLGPGSGFSVLFDSCYADGNTSALLNKSFDSRFTNPNASWDIGGYTTPDGMTYTYAKRSADNLFTHCKTYSINKPFTNDYTIIRPDEYVSIYPDIDSFNWEYREELWNSGGNAWLVDENGYVRRMSQRTFKNDDETSDLIWESNMRTLSQLTYLLRQKIERYLFEYSDDSILKTMKVECENMFSNWVGNIVDSLTIDFERDTNVDGGDIVVCYVNVTFRGLIIRVPIIVNVNRRGS